MRRKLLFAAAFLLLTALGGWVGWLTHVPAPRLELRAEDELHPCFFSDDGTELVTEFVSRKGGDVQKEGYIVWDVATGKYKERRLLTNEGLHLSIGQRGSRFQVFADDKDEGSMEVRVFQVHPWRLACRFARDAAAVVDRAVVSPSGTMLVIELYVDGDRLRGPKLELWDLADGRKIAEIAGRFMSFAPLGDRLATEDLDGTVRFFSLPSGKELTRLPALPKSEESLARLDWWLTSNGTKHVRLTEDMSTNSRMPVSHCFDLGKGKLLWERRDFRPDLAAPDCDFLVAEEDALFSLFRVQDDGPPAKVRPLARNEAMIATEAFPREGKCVVAWQRVSERNPILSWLDRLGWVQDEALTNNVLVLNLRNGEEELHFRTALAMQGFVLSPRGDLLACEAKLDPAAPAPRADTGEFPSFVQVWDLPAAWPWGRVAVGAAAPVLVVLLLVMAVRRWRRKGEPAAAGPSISEPRPLGSGPSAASAP